MSKTKHNYNLKLQKTLSWTSLISSIITGISFYLFGAACAWALDPGEWSPTWRFIIAALILAAAATEWEEDKDDH